MPVGRSRDSHLRCVMILEHCRVPWPKPSQWLVAEDLMTSDSMHCGDHASETLDPWLLFCRALPEHAWTMVTAGLAKSGSWKIFETFFLFFLSALESGLRTQEWWMHFWVDQESAGKPVPVSKINRHQRHGFSMWAYVCWPLGTRLDDRTPHFCTLYIQ